MVVCLDCGGIECICAMQLTIRRLTRACQIFSSALGTPKGYIPSLGQPLTHEALQLMKEAGVKPVFYWEAHHAKTDPFTKVT